MSRRELVRMYPLPVSATSAPNPAAVSGWCASHDPDTGAHCATGRWLVGPAAGAGPGRWASAAPLDRLAVCHPEAWRRLSALIERVELRERAPVQIEFELVGGAARATRVRPARLRPAAHVAAVHDLVRRQVISPAEAVLAVPLAEIEACLAPGVDPGLMTRLGEGLGVSDGVASGRAVFTAEDAARCGGAGDRCVLVVDDLRPEDVAVSRHLAGLVTLRGGATSHAAVVAKGLGLPMIAGLRDATRDRGAGVRIGDRTVTRLDIVTVDGSRGALYSGEVSVAGPAVPGAIADLVAWAHRFAATRVYANVDSTEGASAAMRGGADGIGMCRIEHVLATAGAAPRLRRLLGEHDPGRRPVLIKSITDTLAGRLSGILAECAGNPVTVRLLDVPLHELFGDAAAEVNPMMGGRGVRELLRSPDLGRAQVRAIARACRAVAAAGRSPDVGILVPMVAFPEELRRARAIIESAWLAEVGDDLARPAIGCMIEVPRAALCAGALAAEADFLAIGSNDLTQFTLALSRDDGHAEFLGVYRDDQVIDGDPFTTFDADGVGQLVRLCVEQARTRRPGIPIGVCGEHAGDAASLAWLMPLTLDYVSCAPGRVPVARFAAGRAALAHSMGRVG